MKRRDALALLGAVSLAGCAGLRTSEQDTDSESVDFDVDGAEGIGFFDDDEEIGRIGVLQRPFREVRFPFTVGTQLKEEVEWRELTVEFTVPDDDIRPPDLFLRGDTTIPIASLDRRDTADESTTLKIQGQVDEFELDFIAIPFENDIEEIPIELNTRGKIAANGIRETVYLIDGSVSATLEQQV